ncbi:MAG: sugar transferase [Bdellovibrionota bacterium]|nr:sugar transferase [Bdellovibrionota bacterium]
MTNRPKKILLLTGDIVFFIISMIIIILIENTKGLYSRLAISHYWILLVIIPVWTTSFFIEGLYSLRTFNRHGMIISLLRAIIIATIVSTGILYFFDIFGITPKTNLIIFSFLAFVFTYLWRKTFLSLFSYDAFTRSVTFIGKSDEYNELKDIFKTKPYLGFKVVDHFHCLTKSDKEIKSNIIVIDNNMLSSDIVANALFQLLNSGISIIPLSDFIETVSGRIPVKTIDHTWFLNSNANFKQGSYHLTSPIIDKALAILLLLFVIPLFAILIPILLIFNGRPIFYSQTRTGLNGKNFKIWKLRTMRVDAEKSGAQWAQKNDSRITPIGKFLRASRLDELPQLINILNGSMSFVGPRPERPEIIKEKLETVIPFYNYRHLVKPGVTGWAQVNYGYGNSKEDSLIKLQYDLYYVKNKNTWLDLRIILMTINSVLSRTGL